MALSAIRIRSTVYASRPWKHLTTGSRTGGVEGGAAPKVDIAFIDSRTRDRGTREIWLAGSVLCWNAEAINTFFVGVTVVIGETGTSSTNTLIRKTLGIEEASII